MIMSDARCMIPVAKSPNEYHTYRISPDSSNKLAIAFDPLRGGTHIIENTGKSRLYTLTIMVLNEEFAELIHSGTPVELDEEDLAVLRGEASFVLC